MSGPDPSQGACVAGAMLEVRGLQAWYGRAQVLFGIDLTIASGEVLALMGRNGAGKSTTIRAIMGLLDASRGEIAFEGERIERLPAYRIARLGIGYVPEDRRIFTDLTVLENLETGRRPPREGVPHWTVERVFELFPNLARMPDRPGGQMSGGEQQMLSVARTLMGNPRLLLLDEPSEGVAPVVVEQMADSVAALKAAGLSVLLSEQNLPFAAEVADRACVLERGQLRFSGPMADLMADRDARSAWLGV